ncbi:hypothetical protein [Bacteroides sp.]
MKKIVIIGAALAALTNTANAQFAIENNSKMGAKVESVSETTKRFSLDFSSDAEVGGSVQIKGLYARAYDDAGESVSVDQNRGKCESLNGNGNPLVLGEVPAIVSAYGTQKPVVGFIGVDNMDKAFGMFPGSAYKNVELAVVFSLRGCNMESGVKFDLVTADAGTTGGKNSYKLLVGIDTRNDLGVNDYEALEKASSADNTDKWFVFDNIYTSGEKGDRKTIDLMQLINKNATDLSYKTVYLFLYTTGASAAIEDGKYDPVVCFDNLSFTYGQPTWLSPEITAVDQNYNYNDSVPVDVEINTSKEFKFRVKSKNRGGTLVFRCNADKLPQQSIRWDFPETGAIKANDGNGNYTVDVAYSHSPSEGTGSQVIMTVPAPEAGSLADDDLEVTLLYKAPKRVIARPGVDKVEVDNGIRYFMTVLARTVEAGTGIQDMENEQQATVCVENGILKILDASTPADIYSLSGSKIMTVSSEQIADGITLNQGFYLVRVNDSAYKVVMP